jgi:TolA-binding protein
MNRPNFILIVLLAAAAAAAVTGWRRVGQLRAEADAARNESQAQEQQAAASTTSDEAQRQAELENLRGQTSELLRLRNQVNQLRSAAKEAERLRAEVQQLRSDNQQLRTAAGAAPAATPATDAHDQFPRDKWAFSGYATPDAALVSAIWAMKEGNPKTYLDSLAPDEKARLAKVWENKSEAEIAAKHQQDVSPITGMRILDRTTVAPDQVQMNVYIQGVDRMEKVSMVLIDNEWKFNGYIRDPKK